MGLVLETLRKNSEYFSNRVDDKKPMLSFPTGVPIADYLLGEVIPIFGKDGQVYKHLNLGMRSGVVSSIGRTQSGKTSLAIKTSMNIVQQHPNSQLYYRDCEMRTNEARISALTGASYEVLQNKMDYKRFRMSLDEIHSELRTIATAKERLRETNPSSIMYRTRYTGSDGKPIEVFAPDVYIVDSLPSVSLLTEDEEIKTGSRYKDEYDIKETDVNRRVEGMQQAGSVKLLLNKVLGLLNKYNIRLILINHITKDLAIGTPSYMITKQLTYLKKDEKISGGTAYLHFSDVILRTDFVGRLDEGEFGNMIYGTRNKITMVKNTTNLSGVPVELIFDQKTGYNALLSNYQYITNRGYGIGGTPRSAFLLNCPSITFTKKTLWETLVKDFKENPSNPQLVRALIETTSRCLYYDMIVKSPDPNPEHWTSKNPSHISYFDGVKSK